MAKRVEFADFLKRAEEQHGGRFTYDSASYTKMSEKVRVKCPEHGWFEVIASNHLKRGGGCRACMKRSIGLKNRESYESLIERAKTVHGDKYTYIGVEYRKNQAFLKVRCSRHGEFVQAAVHHTKGGGCPDCGRESSAALRTKRSNTFIEEASDKHGGKFDYSKVEYKGAHTPVTIICPIHGEFEQTPSVHLNTKGCPKCSYSRTGESLKTAPSKIRAKLESIHKDSLIIEFPPNFGWQSELTCTCPVHGEFKKTARLLERSGCNKCSLERTAFKATKTIDEFVEQCRLKHGDRYDYSKVVYKNTRLPVEIVCPTHGSFWQTPDKHLRGHGCPMCASSGKSRMEQELADFVKSLIPEHLVEQQYRVDGYGVHRSLDIAVPMIGFGIEFNGLYWHSEVKGKDSCYHSNKNNIALYEGIHDVLHIYEDDWLFRRHIVENLIKYRLLLLKPIGARKTEVCAVEDIKAKSFYNRYHLQGASLACKQVHYGLKYKDELVAVMSFSQHSSGRRKLDTDRWELIRFASSKVITGGASKLFKQFIKDFNPKSVLSFSWNHLFNGNVYKQMGFEKIQLLPPDYMYVDKVNRRRLHKSGFQHSKLKSRFRGSYDPNKTEKENCEANGFFRIWDCGKTRWLWQK